MKLKYLLILLLIAGLLVACGSDEAEEPEAEEPAAEVEEPAEEAEEPAEEPTEEAKEVSADADAEGIEAIRIAIVMPSPITDLAWSQAMYDALLRVQEEAGADVVDLAYTEGMFNVTDAAAAIRDYAADGYDIVIAHGTQYGTSMFEIAPDFPDTSFAWGTATDVGTEAGLDNIFAYEARAEEGGYVNGVLAANLSDSGVIGVVGPVEAGDAKLYIDGFVAGAMAANPDGQVNVSYTGSFGDTALAAEAANTHIQAGADILTGSAQQVVGAIGVADEQGIPWMGTQADQSPLAPDIVVASQLYDWDSVVSDIIKKHQAGTMGGTAYALTLDNGGLVMAYADGLDADAVAAAQATEEQIKSGALDVMAVVEGAAPPAAEEPAAEAEPVTFGMILVGPRNDRGWSQAHYEGGTYVEENLEGATMIVFESLNSGDKPEATLEGVVNDMIAEGAKLIFTTSDEFEEDTLVVASNNPDVTFINISGDDALTGEAPPNLGNIMGRMPEMKAIAGCAAALATETGKLGYLGPLINHETRRLASSAYLGARYCYENVRGLNPDDLEFTVTWIGFWFNIPGVTLDPTEVTNSFLDAGVDVVLSGIDTTEGIDVTGQRAAQGDAVWAVPYDFIGSCDNAPDICLGVPYFNWGPSYLETVTAVGDGSWQQSWVWNEAYWDDLTDNTRTPVGWVDGPGLTGDMQSNLADFIAGLASGEINVWTGPLNLQDGTEYIGDGTAATDEEIWYLPQLLEGMEGPSE
jgi:simple sugar transport system substrate-binding protein